MVSVAKTPSLSLYFSKIFLKRLEYSCDLKKLFFLDSAIALSNNFLIISTNTKGGFFLRNSSIFSALNNSITFIGSSFSFVRTLTSSPLIASAH